MIVTGAPEGPLTMLGDQLSSTCASARDVPAQQVSASSVRTTQIQL